MTEDLDFSAVTLSPHVVARWQQLSEQAAAQCRDAGIALQPLSETITALDDGRLRMIARVAPDVTFVLHAERGEWHRVENN